ncbi:HD-GYP domain-containing protein [Propionivibrio limicola]|uniref:HD-GYP domain-containing protein n=1 Tax=Propionivibrio limicola TaxID=167645 RepID=UPI001291A875|nr:HD domain-containing phosphohydrolase [Propionivibrio limicola]
MAESDSVCVTADQLRVGLYVHLDLKWFEHPFAFNNFKIKDEEQIRIIRSLGVKKIRYDPARSDLQPLPLAPSVVPEAVPESAPEEVPVLKEHPALAAKRALIEKIKQQRAAAERIEHAFVDTARTIHNVEKNLLARPEETVAQATALIGQIADSILSAPELAIHVMGDKIGGEEMYFHSLNVTMLSLMVARDIKLPTEVVQLLGMGALFHDVGRTEIPDKILMKHEPWTTAEQKLYEMHCQYGVELGKRLGFAPATQAIILQHHEMFDGSGYPQKLKGEAINLLARIVAIANYYDNLCNPVDLAKALTPHEALSMMFARLRTRFDPKLLQVLVRCLGVYPPGTIVQLSNGVIGMVATVNTAKPMKPMVVAYDAEIPKEEAILVDMGNEVDVNIVKALRPAQLPREIYAYLNPRKQVSYYFDASAPSKEAGQP